MHIFKLYNEVDVFVCIVCASLEFIYKLVTRNYAGSKLYPVAQIHRFIFLWIILSRVIRIRGNSTSALLLNARKNISLNDFTIFLVDY